MPIYIVAIAWMFVVVLMAAAEAMDSSVVGALMTLLFYGLLPLSIVLYLISTPARRKSRARGEAALRAQQAAALEQNDDQVVKVDTVVVNDAATSGSASASPSAPGSGAAPTLKP